MLTRWDDNGILNGNMRLMDLNLLNANTTPLNLDAAGSKARS